MTEDTPRAGHPRRADSPPAGAGVSQILSRLTDLAKASMRTQASLARHSIDLAWSTLAGSLDGTSANKAYVKSVARESARYWREVADLSIDYASDLAALGKRVSTTVMKEVATAGRKLAEPAGRQVTRIPAGGHSGRPVELILEGPVGGRAEGTITVANEYHRSRRIQLNAGDLVDAAGAVVGVGVDISPTTVTVPSGQERTVSLGIDLDDVSISAGQRYSSTVEVRGCGEATIEVSVQAGT